MDSTMSKEGNLPPEAQVAPETLLSVPLSILLDVDGVVTDPKEKSVLEPEMFQHIENHLIRGNPVALNTGRSNEWMIKRVIKPLAEKVKDKSVLKNFFAVGEKGLTWTSFNQNGQLMEGVFNRDDKPVEGYDLSVFLDAETVGHFKILEKESRELVNKYSHSTFFDESKKAMISTEMHDGYEDHARYTREQVQFTQELNDLIKKTGLEGKFKVDPTTIATDIQLPHAGKHLGAKRILDWLASKKLTPQHFVAIGDSSSDLEMADELHERGKSVDFFYVNPEKPLNVRKPFNLETSTAAYSKGTLEMFQTLEGRKPTYKH